MSHPAQSAADVVGGEGRMPCTPNGVRQVDPA